MAKVAKIKKIDIKKFKPPKSGVYTAYTDTSVSVKAFFDAETKIWLSFIEKIDITNLITHWGQVIK